MRRLKAHKTANQQQGCTTIRHVMMTHPRVLLGCPVCLPAAQTLELIAAATISSPAMVSARRKPNRTARRGSGWVTLLTRSSGMKYG
jgi:hypothetical protein